MPVPPRTRATRPPRLNSGRREPVVVRKIQPQTLVDIGHVSTDPLPQGDIPGRLRAVHPVAASVGFRLAKGDWDRVQPGSDGLTVLVT